MIVDDHIHALPKGNRDDVLPELLRQCRVNGVSVGLVSIGWKISPFPDEEETRRSNEAALDFATRSGGLLKPLAYLNPQNDNWREELDRCLDEGAVGIKLWTSLKEPDGKLDNAVKLLRHAGERCLAVLIHTWQVTWSPPSSQINVPEFAELAERCPDTRLVAAHSGGNWRHSIGVLRDRLPNANLEVCGYYPEKGLVEALAADVGAERVLFGSDLIGRSQASQMAKVVFADIPEKDKELILGGNAARLFGLEETPPPASEPLRPKEELPDFGEDHFCFCGDWPFHGGPWVRPDALDELLAEAGIETAYTGDFGGLYRQDLERANNRFLAAALKTSRVAPLATLNPTAPNWPSVIRHLEDGFAGVILHPYLHNWRLDEEAHAAFFRTLSEARLPVWINCAIADHRTRHSGLACRPVGGEELTAFCQNAPSNDYVLQGVGGRQVSRMLGEHAGDASLRFEVSRLTDSSYDYGDVAAEHGLSHLVMGSEFPLRDLREVRWTAQRV